MKVHMARDAVGDNSSVDTILHNLTNRPNVQSTLILSRRDGSIIRAAGAITINEPHRTAPRSYQASSTEMAVEETDASGNPAQSDEKRDIQPSLERVESLASKIFEYVRVAAQLGDTISTIEQTENISRSSQDAPASGQREKLGSQIEGFGDAEVQLLRLRLKKQEVIIFPDPKYLCCVIQTLEKPAR